MDSAEQSPGVCGKGKTAEYMTRKILIFSLAYYPKHVGGAEVAIKELTDRIRDVEFHLITLRFEDDEVREEKIGNVWVNRVGFGSTYISKMLFVPLAALKARQLNRAHHFDALWVVMVYMLLPVALARLLGVRIPYVLSLQDGDPYECVFGSWYIFPFLPILDWGIRHAVVVQAISHFLAEWPKRRGRQTPIEIIPNGASAESLKEYSQTELEPFARAVQKKTGDVILLSVARLVHQKAIDVVIRALALLPAHVRLVHVGGGPDKPKLQTLAKELDVSARVTFVGHVDRTMTAKYRKISDIFVLPSRSEGQGIALVSSMLARLPIIATQEGGIADFLFDTKRNPDKETTGWAVDRDSPEQVAEAVKDILAHPERVKRVTDTAYALAFEKYNWDTIAHDMRNKVFSRIQTLHT